MAEGERGGDTKEERRIAEERGRGSNGGGGAAAATATMQLGELCRMTSYSEREPG